MGLDFALFTSIVVAFLTYANRRKRAEVDIDVTPEMIEAFHSQGAITVRGFVSPTELTAIAETFDSFMRGDYPIPGNDLGEHTPGLFNCTAFSLYHPLEQLGVLAEVNRRALEVTRKLYRERPGVFERDYDQLLRKLANKIKNVFPPHWASLRARHRSRIRTRSINAPHESLLTHA